jgi:hypothetical protein
VSNRLRLAAGAFLGLAACTAPPSGQAPDTVTVEGCPVPGVEAGCLMLRAPDGQIYDITGTTPAPTLDGRTVRLTGRPSDEMNVCMQGIRLAGITWTYTDPPCTP